VLFPMSWLLAAFAKRYVARLIQRSTCRTVCVLEEIRESYRSEINQLAICHFSEVRIFWLVRTAVMPAELHV
jgi:hypothetical protein